MPIPSPFHERTAPLCTSWLWMDWAGRLAPRVYDAGATGEYYALRYSAGLTDVSPLFKYDVHGPDAGRFLAALTARDVTRLEPGRAAYSCWCDERGMIIDDGAVFRLEEDRFRVTAAEPLLYWFSRRLSGYRAEITDRTLSLAALSVQGPSSRGLLEEAAQTDLKNLKYYRFAPARLAGRETLVSRTGYTGDLGYEIWLEAEDALPVWDAVWETGQSYGLQPVGQDALDTARVEAGLILGGADFQSTLHCLTDRQKSTPYELGLGRIVDLDRGAFMGRTALAAEKKRGPRKKLVGLELDWDRQHALYRKYGLPPMIDPSAWNGAPVYDRFFRRVGKVTSAAWSPILKKSLALAEISAPLAQNGTRVRVEYTVENRREKVTAKVTSRRFYNPERKTA